MALPGKWCLVLLLFLLIPGCILAGTTRIAAEHFSIDAISKEDPEKSYAAAVFERIAEGDITRRVLGWKDRST